LSGQAVPVTLRGRRSMAPGLPQLEDFPTSPGGAARKGFAGPEPGDDRTAIVRRSLLDGYTTARREGPDDVLPGAGHFLGKTCSALPSATVY
jgi:hypothetical protein